MHRFSVAGWTSVAAVVAFSCVVAAQHSTGQEQPSTTRRPVVRIDKDALHRRLKASGFRTRGGIGKDKTDSQNSHFRSLQHFSSSFSVGGQAYPYTMVGFPPASGRTARMRSVIVPLRMRFMFFGDNGDINHDFDPGGAVANIAHSPLFHDAVFANGVGQFGDMLQRATFWNKMDAHHKWHVLMDEPRIMAPIDIEVTPETGALFQDSDGNFFGDVLIDFMDSQIQTIMQLTRTDPDVVPIFVTGNVTAEALGYHSAVSALNTDNSETLQTYIYTSWLDPLLVDPLFADVSTIDHELGEWLNDPFINNIVPPWQYPPATDARAACADNPFLEVGDPEGNGPTFSDFPTVDIPLDGVVYHFQDLVMLPWFAEERPSTAFHGWYDFPATTYITSPAVLCK